MDAGRAADVFTRLTVGDGLVNQLPALMVSVAGALLVTRGSGGERLGRDISTQLLSNDRAFFAAAAFLAALIPTGIPAPLLLAAAAACAIAGLSARQGLAAESAGAGAIPVPREGSPAPPGDPAASGEKARELLVIDPIELELGYRLVGLVDAASGGDLMDRLSRARERIALDLGLVLPPVSVRDNTRLHPSEYSIKLRGNAVGRWRLRPGRSFLVTDGEPAEGVEGLPGVDPSTNRPGLWIADDQASSASVSGGALRKSSEIIASHLDTILRTRAAEILGREEVSRLLAGLKKRSPALVDELVPGILKLGELHKVLQNLLREQVSIRDLETILETLADHAHRAKDPGRLTEEVRRSLSRTICSSCADKDGVLHALLLDPALEDFLQRSAVESDGSRLALEPELAETLTATAVEACRRAGESGRKVILACAGPVRAPFRALLARKLPLVPVLAYEEIADDYRLEAAGTIAVESRAAEEARFA
jgi:flagellar biosynthesis protein FlhA